MSERINEGWTWLVNSRKWHYFTQDKLSLCGKFMLLSLGALEAGNDDSPDNCAACKKKLAKRKAADTRKEKP